MPDYYHAKTQAPQRPQPTRQIHHKGRRLFNGGTRLDVLQNGRVARLKHHHQKAKARLLHRLERLIIGVHPGIIGPRELQRFKGLTNVQSTRFGPGEGVVVEKDLLSLRLGFQGGR